MQVEIQKDISLTPEDSIFLDMHSFYNIINIISGELQILEMMSGDERALQDCVDLCFRIKDGMSSRDSILEYAGSVEKHAAFIQDRLQEFLKSRPGLTDDPEVRESRANIDSVLDILRVRAGEIVNRLENPDKWEDHDLSRLMQNFLDVFSAIEKNSKGRYRFVYNLARQGPTDYFIHLNFQGTRQDSINMPPVLQDVMRDLVANARKYTEPGGKVLAGLYDDGKDIRFAVEDTGRGIPENEIENVVDFGVRGSNVQEKRTMGGGFGLTKAYSVVRQFGGRMWIDSAQDRGTRITLILPRP
ncbi:histidine kinase [Desulfonatronospira thiodismutans ASO3-1]|uniref:histidine kinase n=1 Tax=Desulfonatronospira thiodismutans ASO3-1 TaxID=555779 RepID=D6SQS6_9BACT|nr:MULTISPECIES: ATP-binding protein [Desulfonatronospira]EFI35102.1 histidine kinase [Desulfonatronospira thiodismutans ASO3-1]